MDLRGLAIGTRASTRGGPKSRKHNLLGPIRAPGMPNDDAKDEASVTVFDISLSLSLPLQGSTSTLYCGISGFVLFFVLAEGRRKTGRAKQQNENKTKSIV